MSSTEIIILIAMVGYAIYQQTRKHEVTAKGRFKIAIIYAAVGLGVGGMHMPKNAIAWGLLALSLVLSVVVGLLRGRVTRVWAAAGHVYSQGNVLSIGLFLGLIAAKIVIGTAAYFLHISADGGMGEILLMLAIMVAFQAELIWRRARALTPSHTDADVASPVREYAK
jgi:hypothetical protein